MPPGIDAGIVATQIVASYGIWGALFIVGCVAVRSVYQDFFRPVGKEIAAYIKAERQLVDACRNRITVGSAPPPSGNGRDRIQSDDKSGSRQSRASHPRLEVVYDAADCDGGNGPDSISRKRGCDRCDGEPNK